LTLFLHTKTISTENSRLPLYFFFFFFFTKVEISARFDGDDSDWERSEFDTDDSGVDDDWEEDFDYVPLVDTSLDSDVRRHWERNAPGTPSFCWSKRENFVWRHCFEGTPGVKAPLEESSSPLDVFTSPRGVVPNHCGRDESVSKNNISVF